MQTVMRVLVIAFGLGLSALPSLAQVWPAKPIKLMVPWAPGGSVDVLARTLQPHLQDGLKQPVVVENRAGAGGNIGSDVVAKAPGDGYSLLFSVNSTHVMNPALLASMSFKPIDDFATISVLTRVINVLVVHPSVPAGDVRELIAVAKARPNALAYGSAGIGSPPHLAMEQFRRAAGIEVLHVPYKGGAPANADLVAGQVQLMITAYANVQAYVNAGRLKLLAVTEPRRLPELPNVPTIAETIAGYDFSSYYGLLAPRDTPEPVRARLNSEVRRVMGLPEVQARLTSLGLVPAVTTPEEYEKLLRADLVKWTRLIRDMGVRAE